jgi:hypothetical protein
MAVQVLDSIMGSGKTSGMFEMMRKHPYKRYVYISIFNTEVGNGDLNIEGRIQKTLPDMNFKMPKNIGEGKVNSVKFLVSKGCNIATTHTLLGMFDNEVVDMLIAANYVIIIDEAIECISIYDKLSVSDVKTLVTSKQILVDESGIVTWNNEVYNYSGTRYDDVRELAESGFLYLYGDHTLVSEYSPRLLRGADVIIMSYLFEGSMMSCWLKTHNINYTFIDNKEFGLESEEVIKQNIRDKLEFIESRVFHKSDKYRDNAFSSTWYKNANSQTRNQVRKAMESLVAVNKAKKGKIFWTTFKAREESLSGKGYTQPCNVLDEQGDPVVDLQGNPIRRSPFLSFNVKATNDYADYDFAMFMVNVYKHPDELGYLNSKGVEFDQDLYALSCCIQWLWRGCIRKGEPMKALIASKRMLKLVKEWLYNDQK